MTDNKSGEFQPQDHFIAIKGKQYLPVAARIAWFRQEHPDWTISTSFEVLSEKYAVATAVIMDPSGRLLASAHKQETVAGWADHLEKAETGAIGRALAYLGYGTLNAQELDEDDPPDVVDAPQESKVRPLRAVEKMQPAPASGEKNVSEKVRPSDERIRLVAEANKRGIPLQVGMTPREIEAAFAAKNIEVQKRKGDGAFTMQALWNAVNRLEVVE